MSAFSCVEAGTMFMPFCFSCSSVPVFFSAAASSRALGVGAGLQQRVLRRLVERVEGGAVDDDAFFGSQACVSYQFLMCS